MDMHKETAQIEKETEANVRAEQHPEPLSSASNTANSTLPSL